MELLITPVPHEKLIDASFVLAFNGEGAAAYVVHGWNALLRRFASDTIDYTGAIVDDPEATNRDEWEEWLAMFSAPDQWANDEDGVAYHFTSEVGEISHVSIHRLSDAAPAHIASAELKALTETEKHRLNPYKTSRGSASIWRNGFDAAERAHGIGQDTSAVDAAFAIAARAGVQDEGEKP